MLRVCVFFCSTSCRLHFFFFSVLWLHFNVLSVRFFARLLVDLIFSLFTVLMPLFHMFHLVLFQSFGIGYKRLYPDGQVRVHSNDPRPLIRVKPDSSANFRRYNFVDAVLALDPVGKLGLMASDYKVI